MGSKYDKGGNYPSPLHFVNRYSVQDKNALPLEFLLEKIGELGLEPRLAESESAVLPLDDSPSKSEALNYPNLPQSFKLVF